MKKTLELICEKYPHSLPDQDLIEVVLEVEAEAEETWVMEHGARRPLFFDRAVLGGQAADGKEGTDHAERGRTKGDRAIVCAGGGFAKFWPASVFPVCLFLIFFPFRVGLAAAEGAFSTGRSFIARATHQDNHAGYFGKCIVITVRAHINNLQ